MRYTFDMPNNKNWQKVKRRGWIARGILCGIIVAIAVALIIIYG